MSDQLFYLFSAVLLGLVIGALIMYFSSGGSKDSEKTIAELEKKLNNYQNEVADHFEETANLVDDMTQSYKKVFDHLGKSARLLMTDEQIAEQIEKRKGNKVTLEFLTEDTQDEILEEPHLSHNHNEETLKLPTEQKDDLDQPDKSNSSEDLDNSYSNNAENEIMDENLNVEIEDVVDLEQEVKIREKNIYN